ncbi:uncharacterized protein LOC126263687 [Schistocerca nitens]|uniref:uncharacterized protein LOC126213234 n=3 Tax=Schistocerca TaxID=7008 RepID=UPI0021190A07|nr:uncharacterized protein LOC126092287 isoform X1 [Schistocerca cancellata]XP_049763796.1 uncharacterized protein LOC126092313 isoform X1 [Schistocerca cancellata]XP_049766917.1 uncharacterized protein LOC126100348 isoform X1 [Schistocerca cancellata]XP_049767298.1 uncharacterized protein LOC126100722 isoform X1 [Schistocerca cancellata]XP_049773418.1 uncharacterized protein LOC126161535 isoform X1 [Schistocerca cancellata]XP_049785866.1 uncharacterized protein LOC126188318 isoform X1 [Schist
MSSLFYWYCFDSAVTRRVLKYRRTRRLWIHPINSDRHLGEFFSLHEELKNYPEKFYSYYRMNHNTFQYVLQNIQDKISKQNTNFRRSITAEEKLCITIRYLSTGISFHALASSFRLGVSTVSVLVKDVCMAIWESLAPIHLPTPTVSRFKEIASEMHTRWGFPNCVGCIDGKHIRVQCPKLSGSMFYNYKQYYSIVLQAVADANYKFIAVDVGAYGKQSDAGVFKESMLYKKLTNGELLLPPPTRLEGMCQELPYVILGDEAYPLLENLMRPFPRRNLDNEKILYNDMHSRARKVVECAFGIMTNKWRLLRKEIETSVDVADHIVKCICLLHNIVIDREGCNVEAEKFCNNADMQTAGATFNRNSTLRSKTVRNTFVEYFVKNAT